MKNLVTFLFLVTLQNVYSQTLTWESFVDSIPTLSSSRPADLNLDGVLDIVIGGGTDGAQSASGVMAFDGLDGSLLWKTPSRNEVFGSPVFLDINNDAVEDVFITGREAQFLALDGVTGALIWDFLPLSTNPADSGWYNFYNPQFIEDVNGDSFSDLLVSNGGDHTAPEWETNRPPGHIMVLSSADGGILAQAVVPDSAETYCSPIVCDVENNGFKWVLFGTGGENIGGNFYACPLSSILNNTMDGAIVLATDSLKGFIAPSSVVWNQVTSSYDIYVLSYDGKLQKFSGADFSETWSFQHPETESSAAPVIGNFTGDITPDVYLTLFKGIAPSYSDFYQVMLDGSNGAIKFLDSLGQINYASGNAVDLNNDGRDEAIASVTYFQNGFFEHRLEQIDFETNTITAITPTDAGVNFGSTPLFTDLDADGSLDLVYASKKDSLNPVAWNGIYVRRIDLGSTIPNSGIAWGSYLGNAYDGAYSYSPVFCGDNAVVSSSAIANPSCNGFADGALTPNTLGLFEPYTFLWSTGSVQPAISNLLSGPYTVRVTDAAGCYEDVFYELSDPYEITYGAISSPTCPEGIDGNATLSSSGCPCMFSMCTFLWENGMTTKPNDSLVSGWNSVTIVHTDGCVVVDSVLIPDALPVIAGFATQNISCSGGSDGLVSMLLDSVYIPYQIMWSNGDSTVFTDSLNIGVQSVWVEDGRGCLDSLAFELFAPEELILETDFTPYLCSGVSDGMISLSANGGEPGYDFYINGLPLDSTESNSFGAGVYDVLVTDSNECADEESFEIVSLDPISASFVTTPASGENTENGIAVVTPSGGLPPYTFNWSSFHTDPIAVYLNPGWYTVLITDDNGCEFEDSVYVGILATQELNGLRLRAYPNPSKGIVYLSQNCQEIQLFSYDGKWICSKLESDFIDLSLLTNGLYYLSLRNEDGVLKVPIIRISN